MLRKDEREITNYEHSVRGKRKKKGGRISKKKKPLEEVGFIS